VCVCVFEASVILEHTFSFCVFKKRKNPSAKKINSRVKISIQKKLQNT
jgi:hypothetical protein